MGPLRSAGAADEPPRQGRGAAGRELCPGGSSALAAAGRAPECGARLAGREAAARGLPRPPGGPAEQRARRRAAAALLPRVPRRRGGLRAHDAGQGRHKSGRAGAVQCGLAEIGPRYVSAFMGLLR